ncbi:Abietadienol/abietadienal oxidase [Acorus calamus]|uniref:Abietadienol/abietadienal oxidase n=1 Tax=Acorus calamus TaxID=4465 RepID=A0AAV9FGW3_ACOCL|nr:Abietadienol/abietadienal oxidase [Acorus calamus]
MEDIYGLLLIITTTIIIFMTFLLQARRKKVSASFLKLPPGDRGWPLIGHSLNWFLAVSGSHPPSFVERQVERYGKIFLCNLFGRQAVVSADPMFNRFIMQNEGRLFQSSYPKSFRDLVGKNGVIVMHGEQQRKLHGITVAINLMINQLMGMSSESEIDEMARLFSDFVDGCLSFPINLPGFSYRTAMKARETITAKINKKIEEWRQNPSKTSEVGNGVLGRLLEEDNLPDIAVADFIINLLFAGNETTTKTMLFAVYLLSQSPVALEHLVAEHDIIRRCRGDDILTWEDYRAMTFTQCVIDETLRLGGIAIWLMREAIVDVEYQDYVIPKGCFVVPFLSAVHLDETLYNGAVNFNPWRWMDPDNKEKRNWRNSPYYAPFGGGTRLCPGAELAGLQISLFLHHFVTRFRWIQLKEDRMSFFPSARLVNGFQIRVSKRQHETLPP